MEKPKMPPMHEMIQALSDLHRLNVSDYIYNVRDSEAALRLAENGVSPWDHPNVKAWSDACDVARRVAESTHAS